MNTRQEIWIRMVIVIGLAVATLSLLWLAPQFTRAATITVGSDGTYATIQAAIDAASPGDTIHVRNETFNESLIITKSLTLLGGYEAGFGSRIPRSTYVGVVPGRVIDIQGVGIEMTIDGFEIAKGSYAGNGGGIYVGVEDDSVIVINDNFIHNNKAIDGGGIYADVDNRSDLHITNNDVMTNTTTDDYAGIYANVYLSGTLTISGNNINYNTSGDNYGGLYAYVMGFGKFQIEDNVVMSNTATTLVTDDYGGFYFYAEDNSHGD
ncbi:MAG TPA: hypothetical protein G4N98_07995, partial [Thermoflexia bacterium]|nr:hypothetical protein [Thermoflexia bacterium]